MFIQIPVKCNVGMAVDVAGSTRAGYIDPSPRKCKPSAWQHPGHALDARRTVAAVACARELMTRSAAAAACQTPSGDASDSVLSCAVQLAAKWDLVAYCLEVSELGEELSSRGAVLGALRVHPCLAAHISGIVAGSVDPGTVYTPTGTETGVVSVAVLGECEGGYRVALPWGKFSKSMVGHPWDGCVCVPASMLTNLGALLPRAAVSSSPTDERTHKLMVMPTEWRTATTLPLPTATSPPPVRGKNSALKMKGKLKIPRGAARSPVLTESRVTMAVNGVVVGAIVALLVCVLVAMKTRRH